MLNKYLRLGKKWKYEAASVQTSKQHSKMIVDTSTTMIRNKISVNLIRQQNFGQVKFDCHQKFLKFPGSVSKTYSSVIAA